MALEAGKGVGKAVQQSDDLVVSPLLMIAEGIGPFGVQLALFPRIQTGGPKEADFDVNLHVAFDVQRLTRYAPIAFTFEFEPQIFLSDAAHDKGITTNSFAPGVYYSGRRDFSIGAVFDYTSESEGKQSLGDYAGVLTMQYFF